MMQVDGEREEEQSPWSPRETQYYMGTYDTYLAEKKRRARAGERGGSISDYSR